MSQYPQPEDTPELLYKYRYFDECGYHLRLIEESELWFPSARKFNDPFDGALQFRLDGSTKLKRKWAMDFLKRTEPHLNRSQRRSLVDKRLKEIESPGHQNWFQEYYVERTYDKFGVCSLTPHEDDLLMWAHYSDDHKGFCVGISTEKLGKLQLAMLGYDQLLGMKKVEYAETMPRPNFYESMLSEEKWKDDLEALITTKSAHWCYEDEYRLIYWDQPDTAFPIGLEALEEVILGCRIEEESKSRILSLIDEQELDIQVYQAEKHVDKFKLVLNRLT